MRTHHTAAALLAATATLVLTACNPQSTTPGSDKPATPAATTPAAPASSTPAAKPTTAAPAAATKAVPNLVGQVLQTAQDAAQAQGFYLLGSTDATGQSRMQVLDRNWKVCSQQPASGTQVSTDTKLVFNTVKLEESCP